MIDFLKLKNGDYVKNKSEDFYRVLEVLTGGARIQYVGIKPQSPWSNSMQSFIRKKYVSSIELKTDEWEVI